METNFANIFSENEFAELVEKMELYFPQISDRKANLSITGINTRTFYHWKSQGLIDYEPEDNEKRSWVKLNIFEFVWLRIIQNSRDFGLNITTLLELKKESFFDIFEFIVENIDEYVETKRNIFKESDEKIEKELELIKEINLDDSYQSLEDKYVSSFLGTLIMTSIFKEYDILLIITKTKDSFEFSYYVHNPLINFSEDFFNELSKPHLTIPLRPIIKEFFEEPKNEKFLESWGFIRKEERKILDALRNKDFQELHLKRKNKQEDYIIEATFEEDVMNEKAKEIRRILGMNEYTEVNIKFRNDKHLFVKNKRKI